MPPRAVIIAPDSFKGSADASAVAAAIADGWRSVRPLDRVELKPMADGGEGTLAAFRTAVPHARRMPVRVCGPDGRELEASWVLLPATVECPGGIGVVELAATSGLTLLDPLRPFDAHTVGFGQAIVAALDHGVDRLLLGIGGSSSTDGGAGMLAALGARLLDASGAPIAVGNRGLAELAEIDLSSLRALPRGGAVVLSDVTNPLLGDRGATAVFSPQKGATAVDIPVLEANLQRFAGLAAAGARAPGVDPRAPGAGAAGGVGFGLLLWGAELVSGADAVAEALGIPAAVRRAVQASSTHATDRAAADATAMSSEVLVITGEGRFDSQSAAGKVPDRLASLARETGASIALVAGSIEAPTHDFAAAVSLSELAGSTERAIAEPLLWLRRAGERLALELA